ncbi:hypothetical protein [Deinococcus sp. UYEF24]
MKTPNLRIIAALLLGSLLTGGVGATTFAPLTLVQQAKKADVIVQATIGLPTTVTEGTQVYAVYPLKVSETLAGDAATLPQTVGSQGGGGPALFVLSGVETAPVFQLGQEVVLLLYKGRLDSPLVGFNQGAYLISNGQVSVLNAPLATTPGAGMGVQQSATQSSAGLPLAFQTPSLQPLPTQILPTQALAVQPVSPAGTTSQSGLTPAPLNSVVPLPAVPAGSGTFGSVTSSQAGAGTPTSPASASAPVIPAPLTTLPAVPTSASPASALQAPEAPTPVFTTAPDSESQPLAPATSAASDPAVKPLPNGSTGSTSSVSGSLPPAGSVQGVPAATTAVASPSVVVAAGVLGTIRTPAELKAAIVAARASK